MNNRQLNDKQRHSIQQSIEMLERPVWDCGFAHEDFVRDTKTGLPIVTEEGKPASFAPGCDFEQRHGGCPHLLQNALHVIMWDLRYILGNQARRSQIYLKNFERLDKAIGKARGTYYHEDGSDIPTRKEAEKTAGPLLEEYKKAMNEFEPFRQELIADLKKLLEADKVSSEHASTSATT